MSAKTQIFDHEGIAKGFPSRDHRPSVEKNACYALMIKNLSFGTKFSFISMENAFGTRGSNNFHIGCGEYRYFSFVYLQNLFYFNIFPSKLGYESLIEVKVFSFKFAYESFFIEKKAYSTLKKLNIKKANGK